MSAERRICLTGPASDRAARRWMDAVLLVPGWKALHLPLVRTVPVAIRPDAVGLMPAFVAVTSQNALPALKKLWELRTDLCEAPHAAVGTATSIAMRALGHDPVLVGSAKDPGADELAALIVERTEPGQTVFWPRGDRARDLRDRLVSAGRRVEDRIAYRTEDVEGSVLPTRLNAAFFASPSAVQVWLRTPNAPRVTALAIGQTTQAELAPEYARFTRIVRLDEGTPEGLARALAAL